MAIESDGLNLDYFNESDSTNHFFFEACCITPLDERDKFTKGLYDCVALIITGLVKGTPVSLLSHFNPKTIKNKNEEMGDPSYFENELKKYLEENCIDIENDTLKIFVVGGKKDERYTRFGKDSIAAILSGEESYELIKKILISASYEVFKKSPSFPIEPSTRFSVNNEEEDTRVYIHTKKGEIYVVRKPQE